MANEFLDTYTDRLKDEYLKLSNDVAKVKEQQQLTLIKKYETDAMTIWLCLFAYYDIVLNRRKFQFQASYARRILRELNEQWFETAMRAKRKRKKNFF